MNCWMNGGPNPNPFPAPPAQQYYVFQRLGEMQHPSDLYVFVHEDPNTIDDGYFFIDMSNPGTWAADNRAAAVHSGTTAFGWVDGRAEIRKWNKTQLSTGSQIPNVLRVDTSAANTADATWLKSKTTEPR
jgi:hypothetical protein